MVGILWHVTEHTLSLSDVLSCWDTIMSLHIPYMGKLKPYVVSKTCPHPDG